MDYRIRFFPTIMTPGLLEFQMNRSSGTDFDILNKAKKHQHKKCTGDEIIRSKFTKCLYTKFTSFITLRLHNKVTRSLQEANYSHLF